MTAQLGLAVDETTPRQPGCDLDYVHAELRLAADRAEKASWPPSAPRRAADASDRTSTASGPASTAGTTSRLRARDARWRGERSELPLADERAPAPLPRPGAWP